MRLKALFGGLAAATLAAQPIAAAASRAAPAIEAENEMGGESGLLGIAVFVAVVAAFYLVATSEDPPVSA